MYLTWLTTFIKVIRQQSYSKAAENLFISQSAVSQQIRQLEKFFHSQLIQRRGRELLLTEAGKVVYELAETIESGLEVTQQRLAQMNHDADRVVTVVSGTTALSYLLPRVLEQFWSEYSDVSVKTIFKEGRAIPDSVKSGEADIGIQSSVHLDDSLSTIPLRSYRAIVVCSPSHPLANQSTITGEALTRQKIALRPSGSENRHLAEQWFLDHGLSLENVVLEVAVSEQIRSAAIAGVATGILPEFIVIDDIRAGRLIEIDVEDFRPTHMLHLIHRPKLSAAVQRLIALLLESAEAERD